MVRRSMSEYTQVKHSKVRNTLAKKKRLPAIRTYLDRSATLEETAKVLSMKMRSTEKSDRLAKRLLSTWECQGQATTRSLVILTSEILLDLTIEVARILSSALE